ncbi:MAG: hypothetical protein AAFX05_04410 [Planctomycetota bacterium]
MQSVPQSVDVRAEGIEIPLMGAEAVGVSGDSLTVLYIVAIAAVVIVALAAMWWALRKRES